MTAGQGRLPGIGPDGRPVARVRRAVDVQLRAQRAMGQIEPVDEGLIGLARTLADAIDAEVVDTDGNRYTVGHLAGRLMPVLLELRGSRRDAAGDVGWDEELARLETAVRDAARSRSADDVRNDAGPPDPPT
jgi:hypothetical protein